MTPIPVALSIVLGGITTLSAQDFEWRGRISAGDAIEIRNIVGDIEAIPADGDEVQVVADFRGRSSDFDRFEVEVVEQQDGVTICIVLLQRRGRRGDGCEGRYRDGYDWNDLDLDVEFQVRVPRGVRLVATTVAGDVIARGLDSEIEATSVTGNIELSTTDIASAKTVTGDIRAAIGRTDWSGALEFTTVTGDIYVEAPDGLSADLDFSAISGDIESDFAISMQGNRGWLRQRVRGTIGGGGRDLKMTTVSGDVTLAKN